MTRCAWPRNPLAIAYHDTEWGVPCHDDRGLFEALVLGGAQAGLSWDTVLRKREHYRKVYANFAIERVARFDRRKVEALLADPGIIRNRLKVESSIRNAQAALAVIERHGSLDALLWSFVDGRPIVNHWTALAQLPARSAQSDAMSKALKKLGFNFVGTTICYAVMQAVGMINDHTTDCFRHAELSAGSSAPPAPRRRGRRA